MRELTEAERRMHLANCCRWRFDGYTIDDEGMPKDCTLVNESNPYLPGKVLMVPKRTCYPVRQVSQGAHMEDDVIELSCGHKVPGRMTSQYPAFCEVCGAEVEDV